MKKYEKPELEIVLFTSELIMASGNNSVVDVPEDDDDFWD